ncbi:unnamed protein product [Cuscuta campestris]|uniref:Reverse transcriptase domain-containing protein n=1 Tax=Cuscuta campestris TaxID=132261 RepID=A0A484K5N6_9ASTE|nr:unnamed protein product [Cuscuta campestris]
MGVLCKDAKVISSENITTQHKLLLMDVMIRWVKHRRASSGNTQIRWRRLSGENIYELMRRVQEKGAWESAGEATDMWARTANCIRETTREVLGVSSGSESRRQGDWWWSDSLRSKVEANKKVAYLRYTGCNVKEERAALRVEYKKTHKEAKLEVTRAKNAALERLYKDIEEKGSVNPLFQLAKVRERKARDLDHVRCMKGSDGSVLVETAKRCLETRGVPIVYTRAINDMYDGAMTRVRTSGGDSESFSVGMGLHQGSALSPFLFALVMDVLTQSVQEGVPWCMLFVDDIVLIDDTREGLNDKLELWRLALKTKGFRISRNKTEYMECHFSGRETESEVEVRIDSHLVPKVDRFRYLGSVIQADGELDGDVRHRVGVAWAKWWLAPGVLYDPKISPRIKTRLDRISNEVIRRQVGMAPVEDKLREARLRWFGHVRRRDAGAPVEPGVSWKQPLYFRVGARSAYTHPVTLPRPYCSGIQLGCCCCCNQRGWPPLGNPRAPHHVHL